MAPVCRWLVGAWLAALLFLLARPARADGTAHTVPVAVLTLDSDDAEENADSLTLALRSRIRASQGWSLTETSQSVGMLTAALRCPNKPIPADCEQRIADQIRTDRYIYGFVTRGPQANQVTAEIHLYQKSKPDTVIRDTYAENLKDQNDDTLRKIAQRVLDRLGNNAVGTIVVKMANENGEVIVDGDKRIPLQSGSARLELAPGSHSVEVLIGGRTQKRNVLVTVGKETVVDLSLAASGGVTEDTSPPGRPFPTRKVVGGGMMALGLTGVVVGILELRRLQEPPGRRQCGPRTIRTRPCRRYRRARTRATSAAATSRTTRRSARRIAPRSRTRRSAGSSPASALRCSARARTSSSRTVRTTRSRRRRGSLGSSRTLDRITVG